MERGRFYDYVALETIIGIAWVSGINDVYSVC